MKFRTVISYVILAVYSNILLHTIISHVHHTHIGELVDAIAEVAHDHQHFPHHEEFQHPSEYTFSGKTNLSQLFASLTLYCHAVQAIDLTPKEIIIDKQEIYYVPLKIPLAFTAGVPLRAPPVV